MISRQLRSQSPKWPLVTLYCSGLNSRSTHEIPVLKVAHVRAIWSLLISTWMIEKSWEKVLRSDETKNFFNSSCLEEKKKKNDLDPKNTIPTIKHGGGNDALLLFLWQGDRTTTPSRGKDDWGQVQGNLEWKRPCLSQDTEDDHRSGF